MRPFIRFHITKLVISWSDLDKLRAEGYEIPTREELETLFHAIR